jgi:glycine/D-amino acid oxidase-like deaminating enzyme
VRSTLAPDKTFDVAVVGAGVFGAWTAYQLRRAGAEVVLVDAYGPGNSRASSGGESRMMRMGYGPDQIYTRMAQRSLGLWQELFDHIEQPKNLSLDDRANSPRLFQPTGILWLAKENDPYCEATLDTLERSNVRFERLDRAELRRRYPQLELGAVSWGILEPDSGVLMAREAVKAVVAEARARGVTYLEEAVLPAFASAKHGQQCQEVIVNRQSASGTRKRIVAGEFVFSCGPWLPKLFPALLGELIHVTRQEVFFFGVPSGDGGFGPDRMPAWIDFSDLVYGIPNLDNRGFKIAIDAHGPPFDPDTGDRIVSAAGLAAVRAYLAQRMPVLRDAPVTETRVCQYENTSNGDFLIDRHPAFGNVWLVGGGSGHGFKHGPAVGEHVAALISGDAKFESRFALATKEIVQQRKVY